MDSPALSGKRKVSLISPNSVKSSPEEKRTREEEFCEVSENDEAITALDMAGDLATKMDLALSKLEKLDTIEKRLYSVIASISSIEETVGRLDKDVLTLKKTSETETRVNELEEGAKFNETELSDVKRDTKKAQFDTEELRKQVLYLEAYSRRENLKFAGIPENIPEGQQMENTKELIYEFLEKELNHLHLDGAYHLARHSVRVNRMPTHRALGLLVSRMSKYIICVFLCCNYFLNLHLCSSLWGIFVDFDLVILTRTAHRYVLFRLNSLIMFLVVVTLFTCTIVKTSKRRR